MQFKPRRGQRDVLAFRQGRMGVSAVPGSGKTQTLSALAAQLIAQGNIGEDQEVLVVTLVNSAVNNFSRRIEGFIRDYHLLPEMGYRVRTLHGLAHDIVRERPDLVGLSDRFSIVDEREADLILTATSEAWLNGHPEFIEANINPEIPPNQVIGLKKKWIELVKNIGNTVIRTAKDQQATPLDVRERLASAGLPDPLLQMGCDIYFDYQRALNYRSAVDFDDLIRLALQAVLIDPDYLARLQRRWPYILEDEAQDSSRLQEQILRTLSGEHGNWVRVGDPNQAIFETFTTASPRFLRNFMREPGVLSPKLDTSGRSTPSVIRLANQLIRWTNQAHPVPELRDALVEPFIRPTAGDDPQPNPPDQPAGIYLAPNRYEPDQEIKTVVTSLARWLPEHRDQTVAVLVPRNERGSMIVDALKARNIEYVELLRSSAGTRQTATVISAILRALADPGNPSKLAGVFRLVAPEAETAEMRDALQNAARLLQRCPHLEDYLSPYPGNDWLEEQEKLAAAPPQALALLADFRARVRTWQAAVLLPIDQLVLTLAQDLFTETADLALAHKLALVLERAAGVHPDWQLPEFSEEVDAIARNERKFIGFSSEDTGFDPDQHKGKVVVSTMHKAKGLEWDRVYLISANNYDFPSAQDYDSYMSERYFVRGHLNLEAEALQRLKAVLTGDTVGMFLEEGAATYSARIDYAAERLRLLYVGITRAKRELMITWNTGQRGTSQPALPLIALQTFWEEQNAAAR